VWPILLTPGGHDTGGGRELIPVGRRTTSLRQYSPEVCSSFSQDFCNQGLSSWLNKMKFPDESLHYPKKVFTFHTQRQQQQKFIFEKETIVYYESIKRELKIKPIYECRCDERLQTKTKTLE